MGKRRKILLTSVGMCLFIFCSGCGRTEGIKEIVVPYVPYAEDTSPYNYVISPETEEWGNYEHAEKVEMLNIEEDVLNKLSTKELLEVVIEYPLFSDMFFYGNHQKGFEIVSSHFNGLEELLRREDAGKYILNKYEAMLISDMTDQIERAKLEMLLAQSSIQSQFTQNEKAVLYEMNETKTQNAKVPSYFYSGVYLK